MDLNAFVNDSMGSLVPIHGTDTFDGPWEHRAFVPSPLPETAPELDGAAYMAVANARAALAALDSTARQLPNPQLLRYPTLRREAQSTSALEGTYAPLQSVLTADTDRPSTVEMTEILNYVRMAEFGFTEALRGRATSLSLLNSLQGILMQGTHLEEESGRVRESQVVIGRRDNAPPGELPVRASRFVPSPPGLPLEANLRDLADWMQVDRRASIDPVVATAMAHYQFETLHPYRDGNGRLGRFLIVLQLLHEGVLAEPTLTVSPWFEARRSEYYDRLLAVSTDGDWNGYVTFFARGLDASAKQTLRQLNALVKVQGELKEQIRASNLRADSYHALVDLSIATTSFTVKTAAESLQLSPQRVRDLVGALVELNVLRPLNENSRNRRFYAPKVIEVLLDDEVA